MIALLIDANLDGQAELLQARLASDRWREFRDYLDLRFLHFENVGLDRGAKDDVVWRFCQKHGYWLLTANRNQDSEDSLEATIRREATTESVPVLTLADAQRVIKARAILIKLSKNCSAISSIMPMFAGLVVSSCRECY